MSKFRLLRILRVLPKTWHCGDCHLLVPIVLPNSPPTLLCPAPLRLPVQAVNSPGHVAKLHVLAYAPSNSCPLAMPWEVGLDYWPTQALDLGLGPFGQEILRCMVLRVQFSEL